ncbi:DUF4388 domain-containing protein [Pseudanabaena sp. PCC 6802]|uniref:DUF4388 domain-containing protein n=1 Tax=Pseudanabaena sp. PCC 6802 TaxID=118173 RepID=UPI00035D1509|nr:DUF4388 domain-containing protein [Pseudanabaena sp. PCC 6802]
MALIGKIEDLSLPEVFKVLDQGKRTGMLIINSYQAETQAFKRYGQIWFENGRIVAVANASQKQGLIDLIKDSFELEIPTIAALHKVQSKQTLSVPLGRYLREENLLTPQQVALLFDLQVIHPITKLFALREGIYTFNDKVFPSHLELTGLHVTMRDINLSGLRSLEDWTHLTNKLPGLGSGLLVKPGNMDLPNLTPLELKLFQAANGQKSLSQIAIELNISDFEVQKIAFSLIVIGLVDELLLIPSSRKKTPAMQANSSSQTGSTSGKVSSGLLGNLTRFLKDKVRA